MLDRNIFETSALENSVKKQKVCDLGTWMLEL